MWIILLYIFVFFVNSHLKTKIKANAVSVVV